MRNCPADAISMIEGRADINMDECIRCGNCHESCPQEAVRHDSERIPQEIEENLRYTRKLMGKFETEEEKKALLGRMKKHFSKEKKVAEKTIEEIDKMAGAD